MPSAGPRSRAGMQPCWRAAPSKDTATRRRPPEMSETLADSAARAADRWVEAPVTYLADLSVKPVTYNPPQGTGAPRRDGNYRRFAVKIHDARVLGDAVSLDRHGFAFVRHDTAVTDFYDDAQITATYH